jgi:2-deoxystreptamine N-acetyl-D-glucosaminyltransferase/2-deoxystreptamine glucosyltransferase
VLVLKANYFPVCGAGRLLETLLPHLDRARVEPVLVELATPGAPSSCHFVSPHTRELEHHRIEWRGARHARPAIAALRRLVASLRIDAVNSHDMRCDLLCRLAGGRRGLGVPWVAHVHGWVGRDGDLRLRLYEAIDRCCVRGADEVWVGSERAAADVRRFLGRRVPLRVLPNAIDPVAVAGAAANAAAARARLGVPADALLVGMHARLHRPKGHDVVAEAVLRCSDERAHAVLLGYGPEEAALRELAARPKARGRIHVPGEQPPAAVLATVAALDVFAYGSRRESLPLAVLEAMLLARPIVATDVGDVPRALADGAGVVVPPGDVAAMAAAIDRLLADPGARRALGARAREVATTRYAPSRLGAAMTAAFLALPGARAVATAGGAP